MPITLPETVTDLPFLGAQQFGDLPVQRFKRDGSWQDLSYQQLADIAAEIGLGLAALGIRPGDRVAVLADTRPEWTHAQLGIAAAGAVLVPVYPSSSPPECQWVLGDSGAVAVICEDPAQVAKVEQVRDQLPALVHVIVIDGEHELSLAAVRARGADTDREELERRRDTVQPDDPCLIIYTSGTTGPPKGCILTHRNMTACCSITYDLGIVSAGDVAYLFLPLAHVFAQVIEMSMATIGGVIAYCSEGAKKILPDCAEVAPTVLPSVPRIFEKVYASIASQVPADTLAKAVEAALNARTLDEQGVTVPDDLRRSAEHAESALLSKARAVFGGRVRVAISGAAPIAREILQFFHAADVPVYEGYGMSESAAVGTFNTPTHVRLGTIGRTVPGCETRIADDGEILMKGPHIFAGYWNNPVATAEILKDGWLFTGDLGSIDKNGFVTITGRKKDIIITAGGKNLTPANMENELRQSPWISHAVMYGDRRPYPVALVTLDAELVLPWAREQGLPEDLASLAIHPTVRSLVQAVIDQANSHHAKVAQVKRFSILAHDFTLETGELTPSLKIKRNVIAQMYANVFEALYAEPS
ncbi:MAG: long-chain fatty acid--CoA ligase [Pseudonocardia sp.]|nr:long-chain fatty acid--CoA ligase [Pseudonocardia sp.]